VLCVLWVDLCPYLDGPFRGLSGSHDGVVDGGRGGGAWGFSGVFVLLGGRVEWSPRRVDGLAV